MRHFKSLVLVGIILTAQDLLAKDSWINLFNGKNLDGWVEHSGKAKYTIDRGVLIG